MSYRRFQVPEISYGPATLATPATLPAPAPQTVARLASVAGANAENELSAAQFEERAAIVEYDGGAPRYWAEGFARLDLAAPVPGFTPQRWQQVVNDGGQFLDRWAAEAARLGWTAEDAFGVHPAAPGARYGDMGLVPLIGGGEVVRIAADRATIRMPTGGELTYLRRHRPGAVALWEAAQ